MRKGQDPFQNFINEKKELQRLIFQIIEKSDIEEFDYQNLINYLDSHQYEGNQPEIKHFLQLIVTIANNHHRDSNFFRKIEKILILSSRFYKQTFSNDEILAAFQQSKPLLLILLKTKIITIDELIFQNLINYAECKEGSIYYYFYPELDSVIKSGTIEGIKYENYKIELNEDIENFEANRQTFENETKLCSIIRDDLIDDFITYVNKNSISILSTIERSIFETNSMLIEKDPTLIEYAAFFGSIQIMKYLEINKAEMTSSIWLYAVHSNNPEIIQFLEEKNIEMDDRTFSEAIKCHHNDIACYIYDNYFVNVTKITDLSDENVLSIYSSNNYEFFSEEIDGNKIFFSLCENGYYELIDLYLQLKKKEIVYYINQQKNDHKLNIKKIILKALKDNRLDVAYHLLMKFDRIPEEYFSKEKDITKISLPPTIKSIGELAFRTSIKQISLPPSLTKIDFICSSLTTIQLPSSINSINSFSFSKCESLTEILIPSSTKIIKGYAFSGCSSLKKVTFSIPFSLTEILSYAFNNCVSLTQISIPLSVRKIGEYCFKGCTSLTQVYIPSSIAEFERNIFVDCPKLEKISIIQFNEKLLDVFDEKILIHNSDPKNNAYDTLLLAYNSCDILTVPSSIKKMVDQCFWKCSSLTQIIIPPSVTEIGDHVFFECSSLMHIEISPSITKIGTSFCYKCSSLTKITIPSSVTSIGPAAFNECLSLTQITFELPSSLTEIGDNAFFGCSSLTQITIPSSVTKIRYCTFLRCSSLIQITMPSSIACKEISLPSRVKVTTY